MSAQELYYILQNFLVNEKEFTEENKDTMDHNNYEGRLALLHNLEFLLDGVESDIFPDMRGGVIDRQAAIDALGEGAMVNYQAAGHDNGLIKAINVIKGLPSSEPKGKWIDRGSLSCRCSECGCKSPKEYNFCPNCGAKMEVKK